MNEKSNVTQHAFQTEVQQLLHLMVHSLYREKEIFLRELISNASDAIDKLRFAALTDSTLLGDEEELEIVVTYDKKKKTITIFDNGIGMSKEEVMENIGTIARSGTQQFVKSMTGEDKKDMNLIGQFGVGFYSCFMVAESVTLETRKAGSPPEQGVRWISEGKGEYSIEDCERPARGTEITLKVTTQAKEFLEGYRLRHIISTYSDHISLPIMMHKEDIDEKKKKSGDPVELERVNKASALWARPRKEVKKEEYEGFYNNLSYDQSAPLSILHNHVEGKLQYTLLLFIPSKAPFDLWDRERVHGVKLYVRRIYIMDNAEHLLPVYLRFIKGVIDCADLPLNVSREFLQNNKQIETIKNAVTKRVLANLNALAKKIEDYKGFWQEFGKVLKEGLIEDQDNQKQLAELIRFATTKDEDGGQVVSFAEYVGRMPVKQKSIYYLCAESHEAAKSSPHLEIFRKNDIEVILFGDHVDEWLVNHLPKYQDKELISVAKGELDLADIAAPEDKKKQQDSEAEFKDLLDNIKKILESKVKDVRITNRLTDSPACLVADKNDPGGNLERMLKSMGQEVPTHKPILEINPAHSIIAGLKSKAGDDPQLETWAHVLFDQAALSEGADLQEPATYVKRIHSLLAGLK